jgi:hypothetical protein
MGEQLKWPIGSNFSAREQGTGNKSIRQVWKQVQCERGINHLANEKNCSVNRDQKSMAQ